MVSDNVIPGQTESGGPGKSPSQAQLKSPFGDSCLSEKGSRRNKQQKRREHWSHSQISRGAIHSTKVPTGPTGKSGPPQKVDPFFRNFSGWTEPIHWVLDRNFRKFWLNGSRPRILGLVPKPIVSVACRSALSVFGVSWVSRNSNLIQQHNNRKKSIERP